jgi:hypothetical protein
MENNQNYSSFAGSHLVASGSLRSTLLQTKQRIDEGERAPVLVFDDSNGQQIDFDFRGTPDDVIQRLTTHPHLVVPEATAARPGPGRPKLGVVCREVSLLPRHWQWLEQQPQGASAALRRLVDDARKQDPEGERLRLARETAAKFMWTMAGDLPGFEEASRALFAGERERLEALMSEWPEDIRRHVLRLLAVDPAGESTK